MSERGLAPLKGNLPGFRRLARWPSRYSLRNQEEKCIRLAVDPLLSEILTGLAILRELTSEAPMFEQSQKGGSERLSLGQGGKVTPELRFNLKKPGKCRSFP